MISLSKNYFREIGLQVYKSLNPNHFRSGLDVALDVERLLGSKNIKNIFDVGANIGQTALYFHQKFHQAQIFSFEPVGPGGCWHHRS